MALDCSSMGSSCSECHDGDIVLFSPARFSRNGDNAQAALWEMIHVDTRTASCAERKAVLEIDVCVPLPTEVNSRVKLPITDPPFHNGHYSGQTAAFLYGIWS